MIVLGWGTFGRISGHFQQNARNLAYARISFHVGNPAHYPQSKAFWGLGVKGILVIEIHLKTLKL